MNLLRAGAPLRRLFWFFVLMVAPVLAIAAEPIAMVTDVQGRVRIMTPAGHAPPALLSPLEAGMKLALKTGDRLVVTYFAKPVAYAAHGPAVVSIGQDRVTAESGGKVKTIKLRPGQGDSAQQFTARQRERLTQAAIAMKALPGRNAIRLVSPVDTKVASQTPVLEWISPPDARQLKLVLKDGSDHVVQEAALTGNTWQVPQNAPLAAGESYRWTVSGQTETESLATEEKTFTVATRDEAERLRHERPLPSSPFHERVLHAARLESEGWKYEAGEAWKALLRERPGDAGLQMMISPPVAPQP